MQFKITLRHLLKNKGYTAINIIGLAAGMAVTLLIGLWIWDEVTFNHWHERHDRLAQVMDVQEINGESITGEAIAIPLAEELRNNYAGDFKRVAIVYPNFTHTIAAGDKKLSQSGVWASPDFPEMLTLKMVHGKRNALKDPTAVIINQSLATSLFGSADPMGKAIRMDNRTDLQVGGVYEDLPQSTAFYGTQLFLPWDRAVSTIPWLKDEVSKWDTHYWKLFVELNGDIDINKASAKISGVVQQHVKTGKETLLLHPMNRWHLYNEFKNGRVSGGRIRLVWLFGITGAMVLLLACINFMNLSTARSAKRAKETGIRKAIGATRVQLIRQFLSESLLLSFLSFALAAGLVWWLLPLFNRITEKQIVIPFHLPGLWATCIGFTLLTGLLAGSYPAFYLSSFRPVKILKGGFTAGRFSLLPRNALMVLQFSVSIALIIGTVIVYQQIRYAKNRPVGYSREGLINLTMNTPEMFGAPYNELRAALLESGAVADMAKASHPTTENPGNIDDLNWEGKVPGVAAPIGFVTVSHDYGHTIGWQIKEGRDFSRSFPTDTGALILNEAAVKLTGFQHPIGKIIQAGGEPHMIVGVVKDMVMASPYTPVQPVIYSLQYGVYNALTVRVNPAMPLRTALAGIAGVFKKFNPEGPFDFTFTDELYAKKFSDEERIARLTTVFAVLAVFISCLGILGLAAFLAEQRTKEIGIRKVMGATVSGILLLLSRDFVKLVLIALLVATPLTWYFMKMWLDHYAYHTPVSVWLFIATGAGTVLVTLLTVGYQSVKAALMNPVKSLRTE
ncbi:ABC transporter permease [Chitinophaga polysaccharea]|uniref:ABC transporter permease n=1 Tax=Chitinophaga polysaccharea TaxID=1293035 RepID=UPI00115B30F8|nr:ABC transporter permease [Chitinophaga polysaccharea]